jgi:hypothetical protein
MPDVSAISSGRKTIFPGLTGRYTVAQGSRLHGYNLSAAALHPSATQYHTAPTLAGLCTGSQGKPTNCYLPVDNAERSFALDPYLQERALDLQERALAAYYTPTPKSALNKYGSSLLGRVAAGISRRIMECVKPERSQNVHQEPLPSFSSSTTEPVERLKKGNYAATPGSGPRGAICANCSNLDTSGSETICGKFYAMTGRHGSPIYSGSPACRHYNHRSVLGEVSSPTVPRL